MTTYAPGQPLTFTWALPPGQTPDPAGLISVGGDMLPLPLLTQVAVTADGLPGSTAYDPALAVSAGAATLTFALPGAAALGQDVTLTATLPVLDQSLGPAGAGQLVDTLTFGVALAAPAPPVAQPAQAAPVGGGGDDPDAPDVPEQTLARPAGGFAPDPVWYLSSAAPAPTDYDAIRVLLGLTAAAWPDAVIQIPPYLPAALADARRRLPFDWAGLSAGDAQELRLALIYATAALMAPAADQARGQEVSQGRLRVKTSQGNLVVTQEDLQGRADYHFDNVALPQGVVPLLIVDSFERPTLRRQSLFGTNGRRLF